MKKPPLADSPNLQNTDTDAGMDLKEEKEATSSEEATDEDGVNGTAETVFDARQRCMYLQIQCDGYMKLYETGKHSENILLEFGRRALTASEAAADLASSSLDATDPLRLLIITTYCHALHALPILSTHTRNEASGVKKARRLATKTYNNASASPVQLTDEAVYLLQVMRDRWILPRIAGAGSNFGVGASVGIPFSSSNGKDSDTDGNHSPDDADANDSSSGEAEAEEESEEDKKAREEHEAAYEAQANAKSMREQKLRKAKLQEESKQRAIENARRVREGGKSAQSLGKKQNDDNIHSLGVFTASPSVKNNPAKLSARLQSAMKDIRRLRVTSSPINADGNRDPIFLDCDISHPAHLRAALKRIFNIYVQGSAIAGAQTQGFNVEIPDGQVMSIGNFLLQGPFIDFKGFVSILRDFGICKCPLNERKWKAKQKGLEGSSSTSKGKFYGDGKFPTIIDAEDAVHLFHHSGTPPLNIKDATLLFMECSRSAKPALTMKKYLANYAKIEEQADSLEDSYAQPLAWAAEPVDSWGQVNCGLNFMQFMDFIGKAALVAYSSEQFESLLPSDVEKMEHFLHAQMGLLDPRRWLPKVEGRLHSLKVTIDQAYAQQNLHLGTGAKQNPSNQNSAPVSARHISSREGAAEQKNSTSVITNRPAFSTMGSRGKTYT